MSLAPVDLLREIPPFRDALAMTGYVPVRQVSKDFKKIFDAGICRIWTNLKSEANTDLKLVAVYMNNIEKLNGSEPKEENFFSFFKQLNIEMIKEFVSSGSSNRLPTTLDSFQFCGPKYVKNAIPEDIQKKAARIDQLIQTCPFPPEKFECPMIVQIMTIPVIDSSHPHIQDLWKKIKDGFLPNKIDCSLFHALDITTINLHMSPSFPEKNCPLCRHPFQQENLLIHAVLQNEILHFLENGWAAHYKEVCIDCDVGLGNALGFRSANDDDWNRTMTFKWTPQGWTGFLPVGTEFKFVKVQGSDSFVFDPLSNIVWERREGNRTIPKGLKELSYKVGTVPSFQ